MKLSEEQGRRIEISGDAIYPVFSAIHAETLSRVLLAKHGFWEVRKGEFYSARSYQALLHDMENRMPTVLKKIGEFICRDALVSPLVTSFVLFLESMTVGYYRNHRGNYEGEIGAYESERVSPTEFILTLSGMYPCVFDQGIILGFAKKFDTEIELLHLEGACREKGDASCKYQIHIK